MPFLVRLTDSATRDLEDLYDYIAQHDSPEKALTILKKFETLFESLTDSPNRGSYPKEMSALGIREFRQLRFKPYRAIYRTIGKKVYILLITDGRRDIQTLLERRLLESD